MPPIVLAAGASVPVATLFPKQRSIGVLNLFKEKDSVTRLTGD